MEHLAQPPQGEIVGGQLEQRPEGADQQLVEGAQLDPVGDHLDLADGEIGQRERNARQAVQEGHLGQRPTPELIDHAEHDRDTQEVRERHHELAGKEQPE